MYNVGVCVCSLCKVDFTSCDQAPPLQRAGSSEGLLPVPAMSASIWVEFMEWYSSQADMDGRICRKRAIPILAEQGLWPQLGPLPRLDSAAPFIHFSAVLLFSDMKVLLTVAAVALALSSLASASQCLEPAVVSPFNVLEFANNKSFFEIARFRDIVFENDLTCVNARYYVREDGKVSVNNEGFEGSPSGKKQSIVGYAYPQDPSVPAKLTVVFPPRPFEAPYWIVAAEMSSYNWVLVYSCVDLLGYVYETSWILSRTPQMDTSVLDSIMATAKSIGLNTAEYVMTVQTGCSY